MANPIKALVGFVYGHRLALALVIIINIMGSLFGLYYYWDQLMMTPWYYWLFVPDCPLYTFLMIFALVFIASGRRYYTFNTITAVGLAMYGTWTMLVLSYFSEVYFSPWNAPMSTALFVSHCGMALESILLLPYIKKAGLISWLVAGTWFFIQTIFDYFVQFSYGGTAMRLHPLAILEHYTLGTVGYGMLLSKLNVVMYMTFAMVVIFTIGLYLLSKAWDTATYPVESELMAVNTVK